MADGCRLTAPMNYPDSVHFLYALGNEIKTAKLGLERIGAVLDGMDRPQDRCRIVHVAGTNGKGSTCAMIESALRASGLRTGLFTSPHLSEPTERIRIGGRPVGAERFAEAFNRVHEAVERLLNAGRIESGSAFDYYSDGVTPAVARVVENADQERLAVAEALGAAVPTIQRYLKESYGADGETLYEIIQHVGTYKGIKGPVTLDTRHLFEDVPTGLVPLSNLGSALGVETPTIDAAVNLANAILGRNFWKEGRSLEVLGLAGLGVEEIKALMLA